MLTPIAIVWMYILGIWIFYDATTRSAEAEDVDLEVDFLGGLMLLFWPISFPALSLWAFFAGSKDDE